MTQILIDWFATHPKWAVFLSFGISLCIHFIGVIPSVFITTANVLVWGPFWGGLLSFAGEVVGSWVAFLLYRWGIKTIDYQRLSSGQWLKSMHDWGQKQLFFAILMGRLIPMVPSVFVNMFAALTKISALHFFVATLIGKIPAMILEVLISYDLIHIKENYLRLALIGVVMLSGYLLFRWKRRQE